MNHDLLTRLYLRQYAFLIRRYPRQPASAIYHYATLGVSALVSLAGLAILALSFWIISRALNRPIVPWAAPDWLVVVGSLGLAFLPGIFIDKKMSSLRLVDQDLVTFYSAPAERLRWWVAVLSILPLTGIVAACFVALRSSS
ncbi:MAG: hypothetical protein KIT37_14460 [Steroidobacteraceae bacterium]|nr:hypothetical protein [Steroidobacteraceae bacterium]